jgi:hypothetical protein
MPRMLSAFRALKNRLLQPWSELQIRIMQLEREGSPTPGLRLPQAELSRNSNQVARGRMRQFESYMPSQAVRSPRANSPQFYQASMAIDAAIDGQGIALARTALAALGHSNTQWSSPGPSRFTGLCVPWLSRRAARKTPFRFFGASVHCRATGRVAAHPRPPLGEAGGLTVPTCRPALCLSAQGRLQISTSLSARSGLHKRQGPE